LQRDAEAGEDEGELTDLRETCGNGERGSVEYPKPRTIA
jgi:hypothetical protein